jgi:hypothetical protein
MDECKIFQGQEKRDVKQVVAMSWQEPCRGEHHRTNEEEEE